MKIIKGLLIVLLLIQGTSLAARTGGDDVGNGGFYHKQSVIILKMATQALESKIANTEMDVLVKNPAWKKILQDTLTYQSLDKLSKQNRERGGQPLQMDYEKRPAAVVILKPYFDAFAGVVDARLQETSEHVQKLLLHEASHIWGYNEIQAEEFAIAFLKSADSRPDVTIKDVCACREGKSDLVDSCDNFCAYQPFSDQPILYMNVNPIIGNPSITNIYDWCAVQLKEDVTSPNCIIRATDGANEISIPVDLKSGSNRVTANLNNLSKGKKWSLRIEEVKTGSNAQSDSVQIQRKLPPPPNGEVGQFELVLINQYACFNYGFDPSGSRNGFARKFYYFMDEEMPDPIPPLTSGISAKVVCHDDILNPGNDSTLYERLELIPGTFALWNKNDPRFYVNDHKPRINNIIEDRLAYEYNSRVALDLFKAIHSPASPNSSGAVDFQGYMLVPFKSPNTGKNFCPLLKNYQGNDPLFKILKDYLGDTEGLYMAEKEAEVIVQDNFPQTIKGTMMVSRSMLRDYGFYVEKGINKRVDDSALHVKTVYFYWPTSKVMDPTMKGGRKLFTVKDYSSVGTTDKSIGCIPKMEDE